MAMQEDNKKWTHFYKTLLINARLDMEEEFRGKNKKRVMLWERVLEKIKSIDETFPFSRDDIYRKFLNFMVTYNRIKKRNNGDAETTWEFFEKLDEVYGCRTDLLVPECNLDSTLDPLYADMKDENEPCMTEAGPSIIFHSEKPTPAPKRSRVGVVEFLRKEGELDRKLLRDLLSLEKEKLKIEREKVKEIRKLREAILASRK